MKKPTGSNTDFLKFYLTGALEDDFNITTCFKEIFETLK